MLQKPQLVSMDPPEKAGKRRGAAAPDGGYAWLILLSCFFVFGLTFGVIKSFGIFFVEIQQYFETTAAGTSWITSIAVATIHIAAPVSSALSARFSHRAVVISGGLICSAAVVFGALARSLTELYITVGFLNGFGYALTWTPTVTMLGLYFDRRRPVANALASAGECILTFSLTPLFQLLIDSFSWRGALLILGGLQLNLCVCGMLLRPLRAPRDANVIRKVKEEEESLQKGDLEETKRGFRLESELNVLEMNDQETVKDCVEVPDETSSVTGNSSTGPKRTQLRTRVQHYVDYTLITNGRFMVYSMFGVFAALGFFAPSLFLVPYARSQGLNEYQAAALLSISAVLDLFGRIFFGWVANLRLIQTVQQLTATVVLLGAVLLLCPLASTFPELVAFSAAHGLVYGATVAVHITVLPEVVGVERLGSALGFFMLIRSSGGLLGPPVAGFFIDKMENYGMGFLMSGVALIVSALFLLILHQMNQQSQKTATDAALTEKKIWKKCFC
ncbi:monocarboxylate transporter 13 isoform X2 [Poecilia latipinna]|uniref:monocarboxylate transporter 13 isoform X2 n=1 Tax=Poecilia latipinna TaxID=48699 RepID=UPI00072E144C|nr:PREDICTED: monocarboxylate transporter 13-like isoform X2 [Poecilia latipinna]XP_016527554.1 PREDICTED: monocarboxylate transporter 13-like isoform X2 [Poecilia formosa]XP_016527555.1 PREDICTED: monocarboxylate transporter 13-like isoform X2 [Poecilia formosa]